MDQNPTEQCSAKIAEEHQTYSDDGVDLSLIRWMLSLTPAERLRTLQNNTRALEKLADAVHEP
jgi:hypothetical protein